jgi:hypothetical protein
MKEQTIESPILQEANAERSNRQFPPRFSLKNSPHAYKRKIPNTLKRALASGHPGRLD